MRDIETRNKIAFYWLDEFISRLYNLVKMKIILFTLFITFSMNYIIRIIFLGDKMNFLRITNRHRYDMLPHKGNITFYLRNKLFYLFLFIMRDTVGIHIGDKSEWKASARIFLFKDTILPDENPYSAFFPTVGFQWNLDRLSIHLGNARHHDSIKWSECFLAFRGFRAVRWRVHSPWRNLWVAVRRCHREWKSPSAVAFR